MPAFDIVSEVAVNEIRNACENAQRELATRFDFRGVEASFELVDETIKVNAEAEFQIQQMLDILRKNVVNRGVDVYAMELGDIDRRTKFFIQVVKFKNGIDKEVAKKLVKLIKDSKIKVQAAIQGEQVRVTGKKRDDLQEVMALVRGCEIEQPFQFTNFRD